LSSAAIINARARSRSGSFAELIEALDDAPPAERRLWPARLTVECGSVSEIVLLFGHLSAQNVKLVHSGKHVSGTVVLGYTLPYHVVRRRPALNVLEPQIVVC
jgi:hypothetical protein